MRGALTVDVVLFELDGRRFGLPAEHVQELLRAVAIRPLPKAPPVIEGLIDVRGTAVPVLDVRARFRLPGRSLRMSDHLILACVPQRCVSFRVDRAIALVRISDAAIAEASAVVPGIEYVAWIAKQPQELVLILDLETFLSQAEEESLSIAMQSSNMKV